MDLKSNPFYILDVSADANRRDVIEAAEEKGFFFDAETCAEAQNTLINANKRLMAELGWFVDLEDTELASIKAAIGASQEISTDGLQSLSRLTALVHNLEILNEEDPYLLGYTISEINETFRSLDPDELLESINSHREKAGFALCSNQEIAHGINERRTEIKQIIADKLNVLSDGDYTELARILGEQMVENNNVDNAVISDVIDSYEVRIQTALEDRTERIQSLIADYQSNLAEVSVLKIQRLISIVKEWDNLAQPLQLKSQASGMPHRISENIGNQMRDLAVDLHNEEGKTEEALLITNAMRDVFAELISLNNKFNEDTDILKDLLSGQKYAEEINSEMDSIESAGKLLQSRPLESNINGYIALVRKLNNKLKTIDLTDDTRNTVRENLGFMALGAAVDLHNNAHETKYALQIAEVVVQEFRDLVDVRTKAIEVASTLRSMIPRFDYAGGTRRASASSRPMGATYSSTVATAANSDDGKKGHKRAIAVVIGAIIILGAIFFAVAGGNLWSSSSQETNKASNNMEGSVYVGVWDAVTITSEGYEMSAEEAELEFEIHINMDATLRATTNGEDDGNGHWKEDESGDIVITDGTGAVMYGYMDGDNLVIDFGDDFIVTLQKR